ncbi:MAG: SufE family protein [Euryarchaeota archaeon]|jgi:sulfur transfer protein SufE|nr:SufE family protein [Euryarchaeota archaeon]MBT5025153.1 SufE family protein [Euryarchaeota archaeon]MBT6527172.1 SufE family protein [Euryarchaeota archaeon]MBT7961479.1 SufE family protein [Euryarchaeota archaeon]
MTYPEELAELIEEFQDIDDKMERLEMVFDMADEVIPFPPEHWTQTTKIQGCQSEAHVKVELQDGKILMLSGADAKLVQGLMGILSIAINGSAPAQALLLSPNFAEEMGILNSLSPSRSNGFRNMFDKVMKEIRILE